MEINEQDVIINIDDIEPLEHGVRREMMSIKNFISIKGRAGSYNAIVFRSDLSKRLVVSRKDIDDFNKIGLEFVRNKEENGVVNTYIIVPKEYEIIDMKLHYGEIGKQQALVIYSYGGSMMKLTLDPHTGEELHIERLTSDEAMQSIKHILTVSRGLK